jgi:aminoglycoside phosphotransferase (APT) family kinase protein
MAVLDGWFARLTPVFPDIAAAIAAPLERLRQDLAALPPRASVLCHRDLHEGQILIDRGVAGLLDFDTLRWGDPALDVGNLQAHLMLAGLRSGRSLAAYATAAERNLTCVPLARIALWRRAAVLRLAMIYALTAEPRATITALIDEAA